MVKHSSHPLRIHPAVWKKLLKLLELVNAAQDKKELLETFFMGVRRLIPHKSAIYFPMDMVTQVPYGTGHIAVDLPDYVEAGRRYGSYYHALDPLKDLRLPSNMNKPKKTTDFVDPDRVTEGEYYNDFLKPLGIVYNLGCQIGFNGRYVGGMALHRGLGDKDFTEKQRVILGHLAPHLAYAIYHVSMGQQNLDKQKAGKKRAKDIGASANMAVWTLDMDLNLISQNMEGAKLVEKLSVKNRSSGKSSFASLLPKQVEKMLGSIVLRWSDLRRGGMGGSDNARNAIIKSGGESYMFTCNILTPGSKGAPAHTLLVSAQVMAKQEKKTSSGGSYDFTPREEDITTLVAQGYKNSEIAEKLFITADTVKGHLKSIYSKTGVKSRTGLISKLFISLTEY